MDPVFAPPGVPWIAVSPRLAVARRTVLCLSVIPLLALGVLALVLVDGWDWLIGAVLVAVVVGAAWGWWVIGRNTRFWAYAEREEDLYLKRGALFRTLVAVPYGRMQFVDVTSGPLERALGIASLHLHTAAPGTTARIPGLPPDEAARLRDRLTDLGEGQAAGL